MKELDRKLKERLEALKGKDRINVLFVCLGNICRSPAAEGVFRDLVEELGVDSRFRIDSAGTGGWHCGELPDSRMRLHARQRGLNLEHTCRKVSVSDFDDFDLIIGMDAQNVADLRRLAPTLEDSRKVVAMGDFIDEVMHYDYVPDPYYEGSEGFELVLDLLQNACQNLYRSLS